MYGKRTVIKPVITDVSTLCTTQTTRSIRKHVINIFIDVILKKKKEF